MVDARTTSPSLPPPVGSFDILIVILIGVMLALLVGKVWGHWECVKAKCLPMCQGANAVVVPNDGEWQTWQCQCKDIDP